MASSNSTPFAHTHSWWKNLPPIFGVLVIGTLAIFYGSMPEQKGGNGQQRVRFAYFPNVTHAPAVAGVARGEFQKAIGDKVILDTKVFSDGPSAMEALLANEVDVAYVGPGPAINTYLKSKGQVLRLLAGACSGGAGLIAREDAAINSLRDLDGKRVAIPQIGGTQDISLRHFLAANGLQTKERGGTVEAIAMKPADTLPLFKSRQIDAAWVPEPWTSRLISEAKARLIVDERDLWPEKQFSTTVIVARRDFLEKHPDWARQMLVAHRIMVDWLTKNPAEGQKVVNEELKRLTGKSLKDKILEEAWGHVKFTDDPDFSSVQSFAQWATEAGYIKAAPGDLKDFYDPRPLEAARKEK